MKVTKKLLIAALLVMGITLIACNNGNGGSPETGGGFSGGSSGGTGGGSSGTGGGGSGTGGGTTTLPASKGTDPFEGSELLIHQQGGDVPHYKVDTKKKTILLQVPDKDTDELTDYVEYNYSYDSTTTPTTITLKMTKIAPYGETLTPIEELREMEGAEYVLPVISQLRTYTVDISNKTGQQATVTFEGQYNNNSLWYEQRAGFYETYSGSPSVSIYGNTIHYPGDSCLIIKVTDSTIICRSNKDNSSKEFPYTITGSGKQTQVTITVEGNTAVTCAWEADTLLNPSL